MHVSCACTMYVQEKNENLCTHVEKIVCMCHVHVHVDVEYETGA